jgi:hypothetical protein
MAEHMTGDEALEQGAFGALLDPIPNDAYTVTGQGEDTAQRERDVREQLRADRLAASRDPDYGKRPSKRSKTKSSSSSSSDTP